jgi:CubicO group peptidase (beta-lactamase class C family)
MAVLVAGARQRGVHAEAQAQARARREKRMTDNRLPGVSVGVWQPGRGKWVRAFGIGNRKTGRPARITDHVRTASITKTFTATAILQLVDLGRLSLDDHLRATTGPRSATRRRCSTSRRSRNARRAQHTAGWSPVDGWGTGRRL